MERAGIRHRAAGGPQAGRRGVELGARKRGVGRAVPADGAVAAAEPPEAEQQLRRERPPAVSDQGGPEQHQRERELREGNRADPAGKREAREQGRCLQGLHPHSPAEPPRAAAVREVRQEMPLDRAVSGTGGNSDILYFFLKEGGPPSTNVVAIQYSLK